MPARLVPPHVGWSAWLSLCVLAAMPVAASAADAPAPASAFSVSSALELNSRYLWRGIALSEGTVYQPSLTLGWGAWSIGGWANVEPAASVGPRWNELDLTLAASLEWRGWTIEPSAMLYSYPGLDAPGTGELELELGRSVGRWSPYTRHSVDVLQARGAAYSALGVSVEQAVRRATLTANAEYGRGWWRFASAYADPSLEGMNVWSAGLSATLPLAEGVSLGPHVSWNQVGNRQVRDQISGPTPFLFGVTLQREF